MWTCRCVGLIRGCGLGWQLDVAVHGIGLVKCRAVTLVIDVITGGARSCSLRDCQLCQVAPSPAGAHRNYISVIRQFLFNPFELAPVRPHDTL